jgi:hypothetical protein
MEKKATEGEIHKERDALIRQKYSDPIEGFPNRMDQLIE